MNHHPALRQITDNSILAADNLSPKSFLKKIVQLCLPPFLAPYLRSQVAKQQPAATSGGDAITPS